MTEVVKDKPVINIPGCPAIPEVFTGTLVTLLVLGGLPELDSLNRPKAFYSNTIHDRCLRRGVDLQDEVAAPLGLGPPGPFPAAEKVAEYIAEIKPGSAIEGVLELREINPAVGAEERNLRGLQIADAG